LEKSKGKVVLFRPTPTPKLGYKGAPLHLLAIAAPLDKAGYEVKIVDATADNNYKEKILQNIESSICLGITAITGFSIEGGLEISKIVKERYPDIPIVWGGWHPSIFPEQTVENHFVDIVVRGQGELTFFDLVNHLRNNQSLDDVLGIAYKKNGKVVSNQDRPPEDINNFPPLAYHLLDIEKHLNEKFGSRTINYISSQGCPFRCSFCSELMVNKRRWNGLKPKRVLDDLERLAKEYNINGVILNDSNFFVDKERVKDICEGILKRNLNIKWGDANGRTDQLIRYEDELWGLMEKSGCQQILIGAESGSPDVLNLIKKDTTVEQTVEFAKRCKRHNIKITYSFMLGFPKTDNFNQTIDEEFNQTLQLINKVQSISENHDILWFIYTPYPGTPLYEESIKNGFKEPRSLEEWKKITLWDKTTPWVPDKYVRLIEVLNKFVLPCMSDSYKTIDKITNKRYKLFSKVIRIMSSLFHYTASFRAKHKFFYFPIEYKMINFARDKKIIY